MIDQYDLEAMKHAKNYRNDIIRKVCRYIRSGKVLDIGAGIGDNAEEFNNATAITPICLEIEEHFIATLRKKGFEVHTSMDTVPGDLDAAYSINVLEHIQDPRGHLLQLRARMKAGAMLFLYVPALQILYSQWDRRVGHYKRFSLRELKEITSSCGFNVIDGAYSDCLGFLSTLALKMLRQTHNAISPSSVMVYDTFIFPVSRALDLIFHPLLGKNCWVAATAV